MPDVYVRASALSRFYLTRTFRVKTNKQQNKKTLSDDSETLIGSLSVDRCTKLRALLLASPVTAQFGGRVPESEAWSVAWWI